MKMKKGREMLEEENSHTQNRISVYGSKNSSIFIPGQFHDVNIRLIKVRPRSKEAIEKGWQTFNNYSPESKVLLDWINDNGNYGITSPSGFYCSVDADISEIHKALDNDLPATFRWSTGKPGHFQYGFFLENEPIGCIPLKNGAYIKGKGGYALGPGSVHMNGTIYGSREIRNVPIAIVKKQELLRTLSEFIIQEQSKTPNFGKLPSGTGMIETDKIVKVLNWYWDNANGRRNDYTLAISGFIAHFGGSENDATYIIEKLCDLTGKGHDHIPGAKYAFRTKKHVKGFRSLKQLMEDLQNDIR